MAGLVIAAELAQRCLVQLKQDIAEFLSGWITGGKTLSVNLAQPADENVAVLVADFCVVVAVAIVETGFAHAARHGARVATASSRRNQMATLRRNLGINPGLKRL